MKAVAQKVKGRYYNKKRGKAKYTTIARDAILAYNMLNAEKKTNSVPVTSFTCGQCNINLDGGFCLDVSPYTLTQGTSATTRNGNSIKLTSSLFQFQLTQQSSVSSSPIKLIVELWLTKGTPIPSFSNNPSSPPSSLLYEPSIFSGVIDASSTRVMDTFSDFRLISKRVMYLKGDTVSNSDVQTANYIMPIKWNKGKGHHIRYSGTSSSSADISNGQIFMTFRCDTGNKSGSTASTLSGVAQTLANTGMTVRMGYKHWFYDN